MERQEALMAQLIERKLDRLEAEYRACISAEWSTSCSDSSCSLSASSSIRPTSSQSASPLPLSSNSCHSQSASSTTAVCTASTTTAMAEPSKNGWDVLNDSSEQEEDDGEESEEVESRSSETRLASDALDDGQKALVEGHLDRHAGTEGAFTKWRTLPEDNVNAVKAAMATLTMAPPPWKDARESDAWLRQLIGKMSYSPPSHASTPQTSTSTALTAASPLHAAQSLPRGFISPPQTPSTCTLSAASALVTPSADRPPLSSSGDASVTKTKGKKRKKKKKKSKTT